MPRSADPGSSASPTENGTCTHPPERRVAAALEWDAQHGNRIQLLSFTAQALDSCLFTDDELAAGERSWKALPGAFADLLDPVGTESS
jgi:hypothetical protein